MQTGNETTKKINNNFYFLKNKNKNPDKKMDKTIKRIKKEG